MNYKKIYDALVDKAKHRGLDKSKHEGYFEIHHIVPRSIGGGNEAENLVMFTAREHFIAHILLWKIYPEDSNLFHAAWMMSNRTLTNRNSKLYATLREQHAQILSLRSEFNSPNFKDLTGMQKGRLKVLEFAGWTEQVRGKRTSTWVCECSCGEIMTLKAKELSPSSQYMSCGCYRLDMGREAVGEKNFFFGKKHSEESKEKMRLKKLGKSPVNKGVSTSEETRQKIIQALSQIKRFPWTKEPERWLLADYYFALWETNQELTPAKFSTLYNKLHNDAVNPYYFDAMVKKFKSGWNPEKDLDWRKLKQDHEEERDNRT